jgi:phosphate transport system substrate-binding protein
VNDRRRTLLALLAVALVAGCGSATSHGKGHATTRLVVTGSSTIAPLMNEIAKRFEARHPGLRVEVQTGGSSRGVADARSGLADVGMASRELAADEADLFDFPIARDGVAVILHADNPVSSLTDAQVVAIYTGRTRNWSAVGGPDAPITVVNKAEGRSTLELFTKHYELDPRDIRSDVVIGDNEQGIKTVAGNRWAIGYVSIGTAEYDREAGVPIKLLPTNGVEATTANVANGTFPLSRPLNLVTAAPPEGLVLELLEFARSAEVHDLVEDLAFVPLRP